MNQYVTSTPSFSPSSANSSAPATSKAGGAARHGSGILRWPGGAEAGHITAGKFLEHFVAYPWMHLDIAGSAFLKQDYVYHKKGGTGVGVRLLVAFFEDKYRNLED